MSLQSIGIPTNTTSFSPEDLARATHFSKKLLYRLSVYPEYYYKTYEIPKKRGGSRTIAQPSRTLKAVQSWIFRNILGSLQVSSVCKGFERGTSILANAKPHEHANAVLTVDLEDFFPSIKSAWVCNIFKSIGYGPRISAILASICTYAGVLPQGGPCSPKLANLTSLKLDIRLQGYVGRMGLIFTRYADDLTFSSFSPEQLMRAYRKVKEIVESEGFRINEGKTRIVGLSRARWVTGLLVGEGRVRIGRRRLRVVRSKINRLCLAVSETGSLSQIDHVRGWLSFIKDVDRPSWEILKRYVEKLCEKYPTSSVVFLKPCFRSGRDRGVETDH